MTIVGNQIVVSLDNVLFATDFSPSAETARLYVQALAARYQSHVRLMHVVDIGPAFKAPDAGLSIDVFRRIGTRGNKGLARLVLGSTAEMLIHQARCPILAIGPRVPAPKQPVGFQRIVYATDFSPEAAKACVFALSFAQDFGAHLYLCHVLPQGNDQMNDQELNDRFIDALRNLVPDVAREWCEPECVLEHGVAADGILLLAQRVKADLIVLGTRKTSHWFDNFETGVAFQVISSSPCPVLTIRA